MYLINTMTFKLECFIDEDRRPSYAILSHTWGEAEVTFEQFNQLQGNLDSTAARNLDSSGLWKIRKTCSQALADNLEYAWVDTCCINKQSSAELSEAINSMFRWYQQARVCYVYLDDVAASKTGTECYSERCERVAVRISDEEWTSARWFTRGWTLQELIAPYHIKFYVHEWRFLGTKDSMRIEISVATGIEVLALCGADLGVFSIARKMSWAAARTTTRREDMAYSLLGIFDINMPLLYGEGSKAFVRLQEEIMKDSNDQSLFAWMPSYRFFDWRGRSIFAKHPREFTPSEMIQSRWNSMTHALTNNGVKIHVAILPFHQELWNMNWPKGDAAHLQSVLKKDPLLFIVLNCRWTSGGWKGCQVVIVCQAFDEIGSQLVRHYGAGLYPIDTCQTWRARWTDVYLLKKVPDQATRMRGAVPIPTHKVYNLVA